MTVLTPKEAQSLSLHRALVHGDRVTMPGGARGLGVKGSAAGLIGGIDLGVKRGAAGLIGGIGLGARLGGIGGARPTVGSSVGIDG